MSKNEKNQAQDAPVQDKETNEASEKPSKKTKQGLTPAEERERALNRVKRMKKFKYGTLATVITVVFIAIVVVVNIICGVLDNRYNWDIDLTSSGLYEIDEQTVAYLNQLSSDVELVVLANESDFQGNNMLKVISETLDRFKAEANGHITVKYVDMTTNPDAVKKYSANYNGEFEQGDIVISCDELVRVAKFDDVLRQESSIDYTTYTQVVNYTFIGEQTLISGIMGVTDLNPIKVAVITKNNGNAIYHQYDSYNFQRVIELLDKNNYLYTEVDINNDHLDPSEYALAVLCAPTNDLTEAQVQKITDFLYNGGEYTRNLVYFGSPYQTETPNLNALLETWGLAVGDAVIYEGDDKTAQYVSTAMGNMMQIPVVNMSESDYHSAFADNKLPIVAPLCRPLELLFENNSGRSTEALLTTNDTAYLYPLVSDSDEEFDESNAETGEFVIAAMATQVYNEIGTSSYSRVLAFSSAWFMDYYVTQSASYNNAEYFIGVLNKVCGKESVLTIAEKSLDPTTITITEAQVKGIRNVTVLVIPLIIAVIGVVVYVRRKNR